LEWAPWAHSTRLEYLLIPLVFGLGAPLVAMVGANIGADQPERALRIALVGAGVSFVLTEAVGIAAAIRPAAWIGLFGDDPAMPATSAAYLRWVGPVYGFFGLSWPLISGGVRLALAAGGGTLALAATGSLTAVFAMLGVALAVYGAVIGCAVASGSWFWPGLGLSVRPNRLGICGHASDCSVNSARQHKA
jgi:hypothetical protein